MLAILLILIFVRPFISSLAFADINFIYSLILLCFLVLWIITKGVRLDDILHIRGPLILFVLAILVCLFFSQDLLNSIKETTKYLAGIFLLAFGFSLAGEDKEKVILCMIVSGFFISLLAIYQYAFGFKHILDYVSKNNISDPFILESIERKRAFFPFVTPSVLGGYLAMILALALNSKNKIFFITPLLLALLLTKSLSALLSVFIGILVYFYFEGKFDKRKIIFISGLWFTIALVLIARFSAQKEHLNPVFSTVMRLNYWGDALRIIKTFPLTGVGLGNFNLTYSRYAHNSYLQIWAEMGILGIISFLWLISRVFKTAFSDISSSQERNRTICLATASIVFLAHNFVDFTFFLPEISTLWWLILGLMISKNQK